MRAKAYYNEIDAYAAAWLRNLISAGHIAPGDVDERNIEDVTPDDLRGYTQCHFFAGIGVWSYALRLAGWPDNRPVWTGSCPCQPFSAAGKGEGFADERHLWPHFHYLIGERRPAIVFGEQVASKDGLGWLDLVQTDLEGTGYACGAIDTCSAGSGAPHIRQRLRFVAERLEHPTLDGREQRRAEPGERSTLGGRSFERLAHPENHRHEQRELGGQASTQRSPSVRRPERWEGCGRDDVADASSPERLAHHHHHAGLEGRFGESERRAECVAGPRSVDGRLADAAISGGRPLNGQSRSGIQSPEQAGGRGVPSGRPGPTNGFWRDADWLFCRDGKWRPVEPGTFPLAHGAPSRVGRLRAYGNAVDAEATKHFIQAYLETQNA